MNYVIGTIIKNSKTLRIDILTIDSKSSTVDDRRKHLTKYTPFSRIERANDKIHTPFVP